MMIFPRGDTLGIPGSQVLAQQTDIAGRTVGRSGAAV
jgi:hypothetical protein